MPWLDLPFKEIDVNEVYRKDTNLKKEDVDILIKWVESQPHLPHTTELQIILFLHSTLYNVEEAKATIDHYFTAKTSYKELFGSRTLNDPLFNTATKCLLMAPLMTLTPSGDMIMIGKLMDHNIAHYTPAGHIRLFDVTTLLFLHQNGPANGLQLIADLTNASFSHFFKYSTSVVRTFVNYLQESLPIRLKYVHLINVAYFVDKFILLAKPIMRKELYESIKVHTNIETLYEYIPKDLLPQDYGGLSDSSEILQAKIISKIEDSQDFLIFQEHQDVNESKRPKMIKKIKSRIGGIESLKPWKN